jgi:hypothetical protein
MGVFHTLSAGNAGQFVPGNVVAEVTWASRLDPWTDRFVAATAEGTRTVRADATMSAVTQRSRANQLNESRGGRGARFASGN